MLLVVLLKHILLLEVSEEHHDLVQDTLNVIVSHALQALTQLVVHEQADELRAALAEVDERLKAVVQHVLESLVVVEGGGDDPAASMAVNSKTAGKFQLCQVRNVVVLLVPICLVGTCIAQACKSPIGRSLEGLL